MACVGPKYQRNIQPPLDEMHGNLQHTKVLPHSSIHLHTHTMCVLRKGSRAGFSDAGGELVSVPVAWFNNEGGWKKNFTHPDRTFVVAIVEYSDPQTARHDMCILGAPPGENFEINQTAFEDFKALWHDHGGRTQPSYTMKATSIGPFVDVSQSPPPHPKRKGPNTTLHTHRIQRVTYCYST
jgi:hypothetical protein